MADVEDNSILHGVRREHEETPIVSDMDTEREKSPDFASLLNMATVSSQVASTSHVTREEAALLARDLAGTNMAPGDTNKPEKKRKRQNSSLSSVATSAIELEEDPLPPENDDAATTTVPPSLKKVSWYDRSKSPNIAHLDITNSSSHLADKNLSTTRDAPTKPHFDRVRDMIPESAWPFFNELRSTIEKRAKSATRLEHYERMISKKTVLSELHYLPRLPQGITLTSQEKATWEAHLTSHEADMMALTRSALRRQTTHLDVEGTRLSQNFKAILLEENVPPETMKKIISIIGDKTSKEVSQYKSRLAVIEDKESESYNDLKRKCHFLNGRGPQPTPRGQQRTRSSSPRRRTNRAPRNSSLPRQQTEEFPALPPPARPEARPQAVTQQHTTQNPPVLTELLDRLKALEKRTSIQHPTTSHPYHRSPTQRGRGRGRWNRGRNGGQVPRGRYSPKRGRGHYRHY